MTAEQLAQVAYRAYGQTTGFKNFRGEPMPTWADLGTRIQDAWMAAAAAVADQVGDPETECGHSIVDAGGETQHHDIPDDGAPHAPTTECGCGPQRVIVGGHVVYEHADQDADPEE